MVKEIVWSKASIKDRLKIYVYWEDHNKSDTYSKKLETLFNQTTKLLANFPQLGTKTNYQNTRIKIVNHFKIFYIDNLTSIIILRIYDSRQNPEKIKF